MNITRDNLDDIFISDRDHDPFRVKYSLEGDQSVPSAVVFEEKGIGGQRQVALNIGTVQLVTDDEYQKLWDSKPAVPSDVKSPAQADTSATTQP